MLQEISRPSLTSKIFSDSVTGKHTLRCYPQPIHYDAGSGDFRDTDFALCWDGILRGWLFSDNNFRPFIPEYADQTATFRDVFNGKNQVVSYTPTCSHVQGRLVTAENLRIENLDTETVANCVIYDNAFGNGMDLIYYFEKAGMRKCVRYRKDFFPKGDTTIAIKVTFPADVYRAEKETDIVTLSAGAYKLNLTKDKTFDTAKLTFIGNAGNYTIIKPFRIWEKSGLKSKSSAILVAFKNDGKDLWLIKKIPKAFFDGCVDDVFTDATTVSYFGTEDTGVYSYGTDTTYTWSQVIAGTAAGTGVDTGLNRVICQKETGTFYCMRGLLIFDTTGLPSGYVVSSATINLYGKISTHPSEDMTPSIFTCAAYGTTDGSDFTKITNTRASATAIAAPDINLAGYNAFPLNASAITALVAGSNYYGIKDTLHDESGTDPMAVTTNYVGFWVSGTAGTDKDPYLSVTYTIPVTFDSQGGSAVAQFDADLNGLVTEPSDPTRTGYTFGGWYTEAECTTAWTFASDTVTAAMTLYAKWTAVVATTTTITSGPFKNDIYNGGGAFKGKAFRGKSFR